VTAPLAEVVEEGRELRSLYEQAVEEGLDSTANLYWDQLCEFFDEHGPRLLAVAEAAVEMRGAETDRPDSMDVPYPIGPRAVHAYPCPATRIGKKSGPCNCGGDTMQARIDASRATFDAAARGETP